MKYILSTFLLVISFISANATHVPGGNITYECVGSNSYILTLTVFEDCGGVASIPNSPQTLTVTNSCGFINPSIQLPVYSYGVEISQICFPQIPFTTCNGGGLPGILKHVYKDTINAVTLPGGCHDWTFSWDGCCRNTAVNLANQDGYYFEAVINNTNVSCNTSPSIQANPVPYNCINVPVTYNFSVTEPDGDSLHYSFISAREFDLFTNSVLNVAYSPGYTPISPINGISLDPNTGEITFTPTIQGAFVVVVKIEEFDSLGTSLGYIMQDFQFQIISFGCTNSPPTVPSNLITNFTGNAINLGGNSIQACEGDSVCFDLEFLDVNQQDSIYINTNVSQIFPGASFVQNSFFSPATASICFEVMPGSNPLSSISINVNDNGCPVLGTTSSLINVNVIQNTYAGQDVSMCQGEPVQLNVTGGSNFNWSIISGDPISVGNNFSCNSCDNPIANPAFSTVYKVVSNLSGGCSNIDTVFVNVAPNFNYNLFQSDTVTCLNAPLDFVLTPNSSGSYTYQWNPIAYLSDPNIANPIFSSSMPGLFTYYVDVESSLGCLKRDSISVYVYPAYAPQINLTASDTNIYCGDSVFMNVDLLGGNPAICSPSGSTSCSSQSTYQTVGTNNGVNTQYSFPAPFYQYHKNAKQQYLFKASELQAAGFSGGKITELSWETISQNGATNNFYGFTIRMGCTNLSSINSWQSGLSTVFNPQNITVNLGWNDFVFNTAYEWDGISNLIVEVCFDNRNYGAYTFNWSTPYKITPFNSSISYRDDNVNACSFTGSPTGAVNKRPVTKFKSCPMVPDPSFFSFQWIPPSFLSSSIDQNPFAIPMISTNYSVIATDINGGCTDTASIFINTICDTCDAVIASVNGLTCYGGNDASISGFPGGTGGPPWIVQLLDGNFINTLGIDSNVTTSFSFDSLSAGTYVIRSLDTAGCYADTTLTVSNGVPVAVSMSNDTIVCIGGTATIGVTASGGTPPYTYNWVGLSGNGPHNVTPNYSRYYKVNVIDSSNCVSDYDSLLVALNPPILINTSSGSIICPGDSVNLGVTVLGGNGGPYNYVWTDGAGSTVGTLISSSVTPINDNSYYYVTVSDNCETPENNDSILVSWFAIPEVLFDSDTTGGCYPIQVYFYNNTDISQVTSCEWEMGNGFTSNNLDTVVTVYTNPGSYHVTLEVTNSNGCKNDTTFFNYIDIYDYPVAGFTSHPNPASILTPTVQFQDTSSQDVVLFDWTFYDSTNTIIGTDYEQNPIYNFSGLVEQQYYIQLYVENQNGCSDTVYGSQIVQGEYALFLPNSFTPNGDGLNDSFYPVGDKISVENYSFKIFNRWGEMVFNTTEFGASWDGTYKGKEAISDAYIWKIDLVDASNGEQKNFDGYVLLTR